MYFSLYKLMKRMIDEHTKSLEAVYEHGTFTKQQEKRKRKWPSIP